MYQSISGLTYDLVERRPVYDNPQVIVDVPRWPRLARLAAAVRSGSARDGQQARSTSPAPVCGSHG